MELQLIELAIAYSDGILPIFRSVQQPYPVFTLHNGSGAVTKELALSPAQSASSPIKTPNRYKPLA